MNQTSEELIAVLVSFGSRLQVEDLSHSGVCLAAGVSPAAGPGRVLRRGLAQSLRAATSYKLTGNFKAVASSWQTWTVTEMKRNSISLSKSNITYIF